MEVRAPLNEIERLRIYLEYILLENQEFKNLKPERQKTIMIMHLLILTEQLTNEINKLLYE